MSPRRCVAATSPATRALTPRGAISQASLSKPADLNPPLTKQDDFEKRFGLSWKKALSEGIVYNAVDGCKRLGIDGSQMEAVWVASRGSRGSRGSLSPSLPLSL